MLLLLVVTEDNRADDNSSLMFCSIQVNSGDEIIAVASMALGVRA